MKNGLKDLQSKQKKKETAEMEQILMKVFVPVEPSREFITHLRGRIISASEQKAKQRMLAWFRNPWVMISSFVGGMLVVLASIRAIISIAGGIGIIVHHIHQEKTKAARVAVVNT